jgi:cell division protein FtsQ
MKEIKEEDLKYGLSDEDYYAVVEASVEEHRNERKSNKKKLKVRVKVPVKPLAVLLGIAALIAAIVFSFTDFFVIDGIEVEGNSYYTDEEIISMAHATPGSNIIYNPGKKEIVDYLEANTYIKSAKVKRKFPSTLVICVSERKQSLAVAYDDEYLILDNEGVFLRKTATDPKITIVTGLKVKTLELGEKITVKKERLLSDALELVNTMSEQDLYFKRIEMDDVYISAYIYEALVCKGTVEQLNEGMSSGRLHTILETLFEKGIKRGTIVFSEDGYASYQPSIS